MAALNNVIKLTVAQYNELKTSGSITVGGVTYNYDANTIYLTEASSGVVPIHSETQFTSSTSYSYTGVSFTIPANCQFVVTVVAQYQNGAPQEVGINTTTNNDLYTVAHQTVSSNHNDAELSCTWSGQTDSSSITRYVWAKYASAASNAIIINGFYIPQDTSLTQDAGPYLPLTGGTMTGDITLQASSTSSSTPAIIFQKGNWGTDAYTDWWIYNNPDGELNFNCYKNSSAIGALTLTDSSIITRIPLYVQSAIRPTAYSASIDIGTAAIPFEDIYGRYLVAVDSNGSAKINCDGTTGIVTATGGFTSSVFRIYPTSNNQLDFYSTTVDGGMWFSYGMPAGGNAVNKFHFGNGAGGYGNIYCGTAYLSNHLEVDNIRGYNSYSWRSDGDILSSNFQDEWNLGDSSQGRWYYVYCYSVSQSSDRRLKKNITDTEINALEVLNNLSIRDFDWKNQKEQGFGVIAQEVLDVLPDKYKTAFINGEETEGSYLGISPAAFTMLSIKAIQEQQSKIKELEDRIKELEK